MRERRGMPAAPPVRLAHIVSVSGSNAVAILERQDVIKNVDSRVQIGALVKIMTPGIQGGGHRLGHQRADARRG